LPSRREISERKIFFWNVIFQRDLKMVDPAKQTTLGFLLPAVIRPDRSSGEKQQKQEYF
jgi:hypothetical protein